MQRCEVDFKNLGDRELKEMPYLGYPAEEDVEMDFDILIEADGHVSYVKAHRCKEEYREMRDGGIRTLYDSEFTSLPEGGSQWVSVKVTFPKVD